MLSSHVKRSLLLWLLNKSRLFTAKNYESEMVWYFTGVYTGLLIFHAVAELRNSGKCAKSYEIHKNTKKP